MPQPNKANIGNQNSINTAKNNKMNNIEVIPGAPISKD